MCVMAGSEVCLGCAIAQLVRLRLDVSEEVSSGEIGSAMLVALLEGLEPGPDAPPVILRIDPRHMGRG